ncbi:exo-alpha-sialidase [Candidatus Sumerlaeota bacterium]|nr:exo-alpha-sialidase [Candidatus Sumerlaeota bacterium]
MRRVWILLLCFLSAAAFSRGGDPLYQAEIIFPLEHWHNHGSCVVECPNGDILACWFHGSGERTADDVRINGARKVKAAGKWTEPFVMADTPEFPDTNCCMIIDPQQRLWLIWPTILAHTWESALMKYKISDDYQKPEGPPVWKTEKVLHMKPADNFADLVKAKTDEYVAGQALSAFVKPWIEHNMKMAGDLLSCRLGWFTRAHPYILDGRRLIVGLYSDGFSFSEVTYTDDWGETWKMSEPIVGGGNIQPSFARKKDGTLVAYMRDNGPPPKKIMVSESKDEGVTWGKVYDHPQLPNPGAGLEVANLSDGRFICIYNDLADGRHSLAVSISDDEGAGYKWTRHLEKTEKGEGSFSYPSIIQSRDGHLHATYSYSLERVPDGSENKKSIKHAEFNVEWVMAGDQ